LEPSLALEAAWVLVLTGLVYGIAGILSGHFRKNLLPACGSRSWAAVRKVLAKTFHRAPPDASEAHAYNVVQRTTYLAVIFVLFPLVIWTGLDMSPGFTSAFPIAVEALGGRQTARTLHFFISGFLVAFLLVHVAMIALAGFLPRMSAMITGRPVLPPEGE
jgi:thiosulfate reductase cytochrome b subunit